MNFLRGSLAILWKAFLVTLTLAVSCGVMDLAGFPNWLFPLAFFPAALLFHRLSGETRPAWWKIGGSLALTTGVMFLKRI